MKYIKTSDNIMELLKNTGALPKEEIVKFFSDTLPASRTEALLKRVADYRYLSYDEKTSRYSIHADHMANEDVQGRRITAFKIMTSGGSKKIKTLGKIHYPGQFFFIDNSDNLYDITVCYSDKDAAYEERNRALYNVKSNEDHCCHIAVVTDDIFGRSLWRYGFDMYCTIDEDGNVKYGNCERI